MGICDACYQRFAPLPKWHAVAHRLVGADGLLIKRSQREKSLQGQSAYPVESHGLRHQPSWNGSRGGRVRRKSRETKRRCRRTTARRCETDNFFEAHLPPLAVKLIKKEELGRDDQEAEIKLGPRRVDGSSERGRNQCGLFILCLVRKSRDITTEFRRMTYPYHIQKELLHWGELP